MEDKMYLSWQDVERLMGELADTIVASGFKPDYLVGITSGGLIPLAFLARKLGARNVLTVSASSYSDTGRGELVISNVPSADLAGKTVLLIDDIADTGITLREVARRLREQCNADGIKTATLAVRSDKCATRPDFSALEVDRWTVFPWD